MQCFSRRRSLIALAGLTLVSGASYAGMIETDTNQDVYQAAYTIQVSATADPSLATVGEGLNSGGGSGQTFTVPVTGTLSQIEVRLGGGPDTLTAHLYKVADPNATPTLTRTSTDLLGGGAGLSWAYGGEAGQDQHTFAFDNVGTSDLLNVAAGEFYEFSITGSSTSNTAFMYRFGAAQSTYAGGDGFNTNGVSRINGQGRDFSFGAMIAVPEPASLGFLALGSLAIIRRRK